ncbi:hypothetical protein BpHYR1_017200 [Brachionus plicatilis]|uniref:Uncharacterized protein n=1 Tax=Brachionus plicatilis TaxID=10195 RepID=A0A3M7PMC4_BRAPC|nr:hypothetical protein BpHYR1_017200 [Brachionus plicatilis]
MLAKLLKKFKENFFYLSILNFLLLFFLLSKIRFFSDSELLSKSETSFRFVTLTLEYSELLLIDATKLIHFRKMINE